MSFLGGALFYRYFALQSRYQRLLGVILALFCVIFRHWVSATSDPFSPGQAGPGHWLFIMPAPTASKSRPAPYDTW